MTARPPVLLLLVLVACEGPPGPAPGSLPPLIHTPPRREAPRPARPLMIAPPPLEEAAPVTTAGLPGAPRWLAVGPQGALHAGTERGLFRLQQGVWHAAGGPDAPVGPLLGREGEVLGVGQGALLAWPARGGAPVSLAPLPEGAAPVALAGDAPLLAGARGLWALEGGALVPREGPPLEAEERVLSLAARGEETALGTTDGLWLRAGPGTQGGASGPGAWTRATPQDGALSWAPRQVTGVAFGADGRLWFCCAAGLGAREPDGSWRLWDGARGLPWAGCSGLALAGDGAVWLGTERGAVRFAPQAAGSARWSYRQGPRWLPDDRVLAVATGAGPGAWFLTPAGLSAIERRPLALRERARRIEAGIELRHQRTRFGYVEAVGLLRPGDPSQWVQRDSDNEGLWTGMYGASQCFAWAATRDPQARRRARAAFEALRQLSRVTQGGQHPAPPGFPARSILPTTGPDPNARHSLADDARVRAERDGLWKLVHPRWPRSADKEWFWKCDTSSDELDGHFFFYAQYHDLVAADAAERAEVREVVCGIVDHLLAHGLRLVDWDGLPTRWANFAPASLNFDRSWWEERGLNSLSILSYLAVAAHVSGDPRYAAAARELVEEHGYAQNVLYTKAHLGPGSGNQSDDEMAFMSFYDLLLYEEDPALRATWALAMARYFELERPERNPLFAFMAAATLREARVETPWGVEELSVEGPWLEEALDTLARLPLLGYDWPHQNAHRLDVELFPGQEGQPPRGRLRSGGVIPVDERQVFHWNVDPWRLEWPGEGRRLADGATFLLPYYLGLYHGLFREE